MLECHGQGHRVGYWKEPHLVSLQSSALLNHMVCPMRAWKAGCHQYGLGKQSTKPNSIIRLLKSNEIFPAIFQTCLNSWIRFSFFYLPCEMEMTILCLSHHYIWEADNMFSGFTGSQLQRNFDSGWFIPYVSLISDLDNI